MLSCIYVFTQHKLSFKYSKTVFNSDFRSGWNFSSLFGGIGTLKII
jgi:hypothetical protein